MSSTIPPFEKGMTTAYKKAGTHEYFGWADRGATTARAVWKIMKMEYTGANWIIKYPSGDDRFMYIWDNATTYTFELLRNIKDLP